MTSTVQVRWGLLRPGAIVVDERDGGDRKIVMVERRGTLVSVLFWDGRRETHSEDAYARVLLHGPTAGRHDESAATAHG